MYNPPDRPLVVRCTFDKWHKKITFNSARNCSYDLLRRKVEQCFSLYGVSYAIAYTDDDGEVGHINTDESLFEAVQYFQAGDEAPISSAASILSGRSFGTRKITLRVEITVEYDGPSLSDTSSLASLEEFRSRNGSQQSFSFGTPSSVDLDDDSVTVSSGDPGASSVGNKVRSFGSALNNQPSSSETLGDLSSSKNQSGTLLNSGSLNHFHPKNPSFEHFRNEPPADVLQASLFERLRLSDTRIEDAASLVSDSLAASERGAAWLRDQNERTYRTMLGNMPEPSESDDLSSLDSQQESLGGDLALERDPRGKYYYNYTSGSASQFQGSVEDEGLNGQTEGDAFVLNAMRGPRPTSMQLSWLASQQITPQDNRPSKPTSQFTTPSIQEEPDDHLFHAIDNDLLPFLPVATPLPHSLTDCSNCGVVLDSIRYVCSTCGEKSPSQDFSYEANKESSSVPVTIHPYPPKFQSPFTQANHSCSMTFIGSFGNHQSSADPQRQKPLPSIPATSSLPTIPSLFGSRRNLSLPLTPTSPQQMGHELCSGCLESAGVHHAIESGLADPGSSPNIGSLSPHPEDSQRASQRRRAAPKKGQLRHSYREKLWGHFGWEDVVQDEDQVSVCSTCSVVTHQKRYKCASCPKFHLCRACYGQVHELHPSHAFLIVPDKPFDETSSTDSTLVETPPDPNDENSLKHPNVKCAHCMQDIVGARFHCAICDSVDICSNCESAGLPGNLDSEDGSHNSSHILIKIPYPLERNELQNASRRAVNLWSRDAASVGVPVPRSKANSEISSYAQTLIGPLNNQDRRPSGYSTNNHRLFCNSCGHLILGTRYQCAHCPSAPTNYSLCASCEVKSYLVHDPMHIFFKLPRPVHRPLESPYSMLPQLYKSPAGPPAGSPKHTDPKAYLSSVVHSSTLCDRCMQRIEGEWFRCCYCPCDLCDACAENDTHDSTHIFLVFKSLVDMEVFKGFAKPENPDGGVPVISYPIYISEAR